ncbi:Transmembrane protein [Quillaja saponaria]|uniref:Transmembrane protein n=1 Tax=Quillaja saponaria TaxID=32244 RepID=A0AAD7PHP6_QUISA|nr:Transmembrane protein [Quillaja saponaria]
MNVHVLDSHLEALAFNYLSLSFSAVVNNLWAWVAVITAAVSFWRIRAVGCARPEKEPSFNDRSSSGSQLSEQLVPEVLLYDDVADDKPPSSQAVTTPAVAVGDVKVDGWVTKGKFAVYFYEEERECDSCELTAETEEWEEESNNLNGWWENWEKMLRLRSGKNGWYRYQDLTELNGNVVRLWDGCCTSELR